LGKLALQNSNLFADLWELFVSDVGGGSKTQDVVDFSEPRHNLLKCNISQ
jgi:hypothetical protein